MLVSWAVPKGPSYDPGVKRLAVKVEDHPLDYRDFEGTIPGGNYGAGAVIVWDEGTYRNLTTKARRGRARWPRRWQHGHVSVWLQGSKLVGGWALTRFDGANWALVKRKDDRAARHRDVTSEEPRSVKTGSYPGRGEARGSPLRPGASRRARGLARRPSGHPCWRSSRPSARGPLRWPLAGGPGEWLFEPKLDGLRCTRGPQRARGHAVLPQPALVQRPVPVGRQGLGAAARPTIRHRRGAGRAWSRAAPTSGLCSRAPRTVQLWAFDLPWLLGRDLRHLPIEDRKVLLAKTVTESGELKVVRALGGRPPAVVRGVPAGTGWEGLVAKRSGSHYTAGRSSDWRKLKCGYRQELVVGGFTAPRGTRDAFGALLLGYWEAGELVYAGKVGTGFDRSELAELLRRLERCRAGTSPFRPGTKTDAARWVEPELVVEVEFSNWTTDGRLRHPRFLGVRPDKPAKEVVRERTAPGHREARAR